MPTSKYDYWKTRADTMNREPKESDEDVYKCSSCAELFADPAAHSKTEKNMWDGYCEDCADEHFPICEHCDDRSPVEEFTDKGGYLMCSNCWKESE